MGPFLVVVLEAVLDIFRTHVHLLSALHTTLQTRSLHGFRMSFKTKSQCWKLVDSTSPAVTEEASAKRSVMMVPAFFMLLDEVLFLCCFIVL